MPKAREQAQRQQQSRSGAYWLAPLKAHPPSPVAAFQLSSGERRQPIRSRICFRGRVHSRRRAPSLPGPKRGFVAHARGGAAGHVGSRWDALRVFFFSFVGEGTEGTPSVRAVGQDLAGTENARDGVLREESRSQYDSFPLNLTPSGKSRKLPRSLSHFSA